VTSVPTTVRLSLAHAAVQSIADQHGFDVLHVKGLALDPSLVWPGRTSTDADVLVRPAHVQPLLGVLGGHGWSVASSFENGSAFEHSTTLWHDQWQFLDLHRTFPGIDRNPERSFDRLWRDRGTTTLATVACAVPSVQAQSLLLLLHAARAAGDARAARDVEYVWGAASSERQAEIRRLVVELGADVAFSVILGELEQHRGEPEYALWKVWSAGGTRLDEWRARIEVAPTLRAKVEVVLRSMRVNVEHLELVRQRPVTRSEIVLEFFARPMRGVREEVRRRVAPMRKGDR
jgi:hypothetical protein